MRKYRRAASRAAVKNNKFGPIILIGAGIFVILAVVIWQLSLLPTTTAAPIAGNFDIPYPEIKRVSLEDAKTALDTGGALILDVRDAGTFGSKHITGSINIPLNDLEKRANELPKDRWILTVCT
jgi:hypothetical protein